VRSLSPALDAARPELAQEDHPADLGELLDGRTEEDLKGVTK
jgi:hypothetical protein